jgi:anti-sigma-K factor RskA
MTMTSHDPRFEELLPAHAIGALDGEDLRAFEAHLAECARCRAALLEWQRETEALALSATPVEPSDLTRARLLREVDQMKSTSPAAASPGQPTQVGRAGWWVAAAALALAVWAGTQQRGLRRQIARLESENQVVGAQLEQVSRELEANRGELTRLRIAAQILTTPDLRPVVLAGLTDAPSAIGHSFVNPEEHRALFKAYKLPQAPAGKTYQLWFIADGKPVSAGVFDVDPQGYAQIVVEGVAPLEHIQAWAVTIEPAGGVPQPTGAMVLKG